MESELITPFPLFYAKIFRDIICAFKIMVETLPPPPPPFNLDPTLMHSHAHKQKSVHVIENIIQKYISFTFDRIQLNFLTN